MVLRLTLRQAQGSLRTGKAAAKRRPSRMESLARGELQNHSWRFAVELVTHRFGSSLDKAFEVMRWMVDAVGFPPWLHRFQADGLLEFIEAKGGFSSDGIVEDRGHVIDAPVQPGRHE